MKNSMAELVGYYEFFFSPESKVALLNAALKHGIEMFIREEGEELVIRIPPFRLKKMEKIWEEEHIAYRKGRLRGLLGYLYSKKNRYGIFTAIPILLVLFAFCSSVVWDVRICGNDSIPDYIIADELSAAGLYTGALWRKCDNSEICAQVLLNSDHVAWLTINRVGTVAYVDVIEKNEEDPLGDTSGRYGNIVAKESALIEEITVNRGEQTVLPGQSVKKGDILISGIMSQEAGGGAVYAKGSVMAKVGRTVTVKIPLQSEKKVYKTETVRSVGVKIFGFTINIFKSTGNLPEKCDIIKDNKTLTFFGLSRLPISVERSVAMEYSYESVTLSEVEAVKLAAKRLNFEVNRITSGADILSKTTYGTFTEEGYVMQCDMIVLTDIAEIVEFEIQ